MMNYITKGLFAALAVLLLLTCAGGSLGMVLHSNMNMDMSADAGVMHDCCTVGEDTIIGDTNIAIGSLMNHHAPPAIFSQFAMLILAVLAIYVGIFDIPSFFQEAVRLKQRWKTALIETIQLFCSTILFSRGILHAKTW